MGGIAPIVLSVRTEWNGDPAARSRISSVVEKTAQDFAAHAAAGAPVDTGYLASSIEAQQESDLSWLVVVGAEYGIYQEMGTYKMAAHPFMQPASETVRSGFERALEAAVNG